MARYVWFSMWKPKFWPYKELKVGDIIYWYESISKQIVWKSRVTKIDRFEYANKEEVVRRLRNTFSSFDSSDDYINKAKSQGFCLAWRVSELNPLSLPKPTSVRFSRLGWEKTNNKNVKAWLTPSRIVLERINKQLFSSNFSLENLQKLSNTMSKVSPKRRLMKIDSLIRSDARFVKSYKEYCGYKCLFPGCNAKILKKNGSYYAEVAHILPVHKGGQSVLGNLLVLCPNHHKEFDLGKREILKQTTYRISGKLNGKAFDIQLPQKPSKSN